MAESPRMKLALLLARRGRRPGLGPKGGPCGPKPSVPRASRPTDGPANPGGCLGRRGIPGATSSAGSCLVSPWGTRTRTIALRRWMCVRGMPRSTPARGWTAVRDHGRERAASPGSLAARPTPPPPGGPLRGALGFYPSDPSPERGGERPAGGGGGEGTQAGLQDRAGVVRLPSDGAGALPDGGQFSDDEDFPPLLSDIPDLFVPIPRRGGATGPPPARVEGLRGSWSLTRQPAACERGAPNQTVATLKRGPSLSACSQACWGARGGAGGGAGGEPSPLRESL